MTRLLVFLLPLALALAGCLPIPVTNAQHKQLALAQLKAQLQAAAPQLQAAGVAERPLDIHMQGPQLFPEANTMPYTSLTQILLEDGRTEVPLRVTCKPGQDGTVVCRRKQPSTTDYLRSNGALPPLK